MGFTAESAETVPSGGCEKGMMQAPSIGFWTVLAASKPPTRQATIDAASPPSPSDPLRGRCCFGAHPSSNAVSGKLRFSPTTGLGTGAGASADSTGAEAHAAEATSTLLGASSPILRLHTHEGFAASSVSVAFCGGGKRLSLARLNLPHSCAPHHRRVGARAEGSQAFNQGHREGVGGERADADAGLSSVDFEVVRRTCLRSIRPGCGHRRVD